nr:unnamed protein product [Callosobruchus chinensis]
MSTPHLYLANRMIAYLVLVAAIVSIANSHHCMYSPPSIPIDVEKELVRIPLDFNPGDEHYYEMPGSETTFSYVLTRSKYRNETVIDIALREATKVSPLLPWPSKKLNCGVF